MINIVEVLKTLINTLIRLVPIAFYTGSIISGFLFSDFRAVLLLCGFLVNEIFALGYRLMFRGEVNEQCALMMSLDGTPFVLPAPIIQTAGFLYGFILADMYYSNIFNPYKFSITTVVMLLAIYSRINIGCKTVLDALYCALVGIMIGVVYYSFIKDYYRADYLQPNGSSRGGAWGSAVTPNRRGLWGSEVTPNRRGLWGSEVTPGSSGDAQQPATELDRKLQELLD
jgi:hypothetical protein